MRAAGKPYRFTKEILDALTAPPTDWTKGRLVAHHRALTGGNRQGYDHDQTQLIEHLLERPSTVTEAYPHPTATPKGNGKLHGDTGERRPLEQADLIWLQRLPADPARISSEDAAAVATVARGVRLGTSDERLVRSSSRAPRAPPQPPPGRV